jgi:hypothetical protein
MDPVVLEFPVAKGRRTLLLEDPGPDWIGIAEIDTGLDQPALALIGRRNERFIEAWIWNRAGLYALGQPKPVAGTAAIDNVAAGTWKVTWWDAARGAPSGTLVVKHPGGTLRLETPPIGRYAAVALSLVP